MAQYFGREMVTTEEQLTILKNRFAALGHGMTENNLKQAAMPEGATVLPNPNGTAPGLIVEGDGKIAVLMPGPPKEMQPMMENSVIPYLMEKSGQILLSRTLHVFGVGESTVEYLLKDLMTGSRNPTLAPYAKMGEVTLRITAKAKDEAEANALIDPMEAKVPGDSRPQGHLWGQCGRLAGRFGERAYPAGPKDRHSGKLHRRLHLQADHRSPRFLCGAGRRGGQLFQ